MTLDQFRNIANKRYILVFLDAQDNELMRKEIEALDLFDAKKFSQEIASNPMLNNLAKIDVL